MYGGFEWVRLPLFSLPHCHTATLPLLLIKQANNAQAQESGGSEQVLTLTRSLSLHYFLCLHSPTPVSLTANDVTG